MTHGSIRDDARHSLLSKAHAPAQLPLSMFLAAAPWDPPGAASLDGPSTVPPGSPTFLPRSSYGSVEVREVEVRSALTLCRIGEEPWSLNPYAGCAHGCGYCYVPDVLHVERPRWGSYVVVKRNLPKVLARELRRKERRPVFLSSATDPYQPAEAEHRLTRRCLEILLRADWPLRVLTRSPLVTRDIDLLSRFSDVEVGLSVPTLDDEARTLVEAAAPPIPTRLAALRTLADAGLRTYANLAPCYPLTGDITAQDVARAFREARVGSVAAGGWRYLPGILPVLGERTEGTPLAALAGFAYDRERQERLFSGLEAAFLTEGVPFRVMGRHPSASPARPAVDRSIAGAAAASTRRPPIGTGGITTG